MQVNTTDKRCRGDVLNAQRPQSASVSFVKVGIFEMAEIGSPMFPTSH
mgnify:CR=1 FL=1